MIAPKCTTSAADFEAKYRANADPWNFAASEYEQGRYQATMSALPRLVYDVGFEPGCSVGELTAKLSRRCAKLIAVDISPTAVEQATRRCRGLSNVVVEVAADVDYVPPVPLDLIVFSEIGYYFDRADLRHYAERLARRLITGGDFIAVHWLGHSDDHVLHGDCVHEELSRNLPLTWLSGSRRVGFRLDCWRRL